MTPPIHEWGQRVGDAIRAALDAGDGYAARRLALVGAGAGPVAMTRRQPPAGHD